MVDVGASAGGSAIEVGQIGPVSVIGGAQPNANPESEMDALLLGRTRVSFESDCVFSKFNRN